MLIDFILKGFAGLPPVHNARETDFLIAEKGTAITEKDRIIAQQQDQLTAVCGAP